MRNSGKTKEELLNAAILVVLLFVFGTPAHANVTASPTSVNFGNQTVGTTSAAQQVTVTVPNAGRRGIQIVSASTSPAQFTYSGLSFPMTLYRGQTAAVSVTFAPTAAQAYAGTLVFTLGNGWTIAVPLAGTGIQSAQTQPPTITTPPVSQIVTAGQTATFNVAATGTSPMTYQWMKDGTPIAGATSSTYTTPATTISDTGSQFAITVSNSAGSIASNAATLTVNAAPVAPVITAQPVSQTVTAGQPATFSVVATGTSPLSYQWKKSGTSITGATSSTYTTPATTTSDTGSQFTATVNNAAGYVTSSAATLTVNAVPGQLTASASTLSFGSINVGTSSSQNVTFTNSGNSNITISNVIFSGAGFNVSGLSSGLILSSGQTATLNVAFAPAGTGSVTGSVTITSNAANSPASISLSGTGLQPAISGSLKLSWTPSTSTVIGYNAYRAMVSGGTYTKLNSSPVTTVQFTDSNVPSGQTYYYVVTSLNSSNVESTYSNEVSATIP